VCSTSVSRPVLVVAEESGAFEANFVSANLTRQMNISSVSAPRGVNELELAKQDG
jgi:hypothetical protein